MDDDAQDGYIAVTLYLERPAAFDEDRIRNRLGLALDPASASESDGTAIVVPVGSDFLSGLVIEEGLDEEHYAHVLPFTFWWPDADAELAKHAAHAMILCKWADLPRLEAHRRHMEVVRELVDQLPVIGLLWGSTLVSAETFKVYYELATTEEWTPTRLWVLIQFSEADDGGTMVSTLGMCDFGLMEIECDSSPMEFEATYELIENLATYLIKNGDVIGDGDTFGYAADQKINIHYVPSFREDVGQVYKLDFSLPGEAETNRTGFFGRLLNRH